MVAQTFAIEINPAGLGFVGWLLPSDPAFPARPAKNPCDFYWENRLLAGRRATLCAIIGQVKTSRKRWLDIAVCRDLWRISTNSDATMVP